MPITSDEQNADAQLDVKFYVYEGDDMFKGKVHVRIITPGDKILINDRVARDDDKRRFQRQWLLFQEQTGGAEVIGMLLSAWRKDRPEEISEGQLQELQILRFMTVEQLAMASDMQIQRIGMGSVGLRERARSYLSSKNAQASGAELQETKAEVVALKAMMAEQSAMMAKLLEARAPAPHSPVRKAKAKKRSTKKAIAHGEHSAPAGAASL